MNKNEPTVFLDNENRCQFPIGDAHCGKRGSRFGYPLSLCSEHHRKYVLGMSHVEQTDTVRQARKLVSPRYRARLKEVFKEFPELRDLVHNTQDIRNHYLEISGIGFSGPLDANIQQLRSELYHLNERCGVEGWKDNKMFKRSE